MILFLDSNFLAFKGLQRLILDKQGLSSERDHLWAERKQCVVRLPVLEAKVVEMGDLEARLIQNKQDKISHIQEPTQFYDQLQEAKAKCAELHDDDLAAAEHKSAFEEQINNLKESLSSKIEDANVVEEKRDKMEDQEGHGSEPDSLSYKC